MVESIWKGINKNKRKTGKVCCYVCVCVCGPVCSFGYLIVKILLMCSFSNRINGAFPPLHLLNGLDSIVEYGIWWRLKTHTTNFRQNVTETRSALIVMSNVFLIQHEMCYRHLLYLAETYAQFADLDKSYF